MLQAILGRVRGRGEEGAQEERGEEGGGGARGRRNPRRQRGGPQPSHPDQDTEGGFHYLPAF